MIKTAVFREGGWNDVLCPSSLTDVGLLHFVTVSPWPQVGPGTLGDPCFWRQIFHFTLFCCYMQETMLGCLVLQSLFESTLPENPLYQIQESGLAAHGGEQPWTVFIKPYWVLGWQE